MKNKYVRNALLGVTYTLLVNLLVMLLGVLHFVRSADDTVITVVFFAIIAIAYAVYFLLEYFIRFTWIFRLSALLSELVCFNLVHLVWVNVKPNWDLGDLGFIFLEIFILAAFACLILLDVIIFAITKAISALKSRRSHSEKEGV